MPATTPRRCSRCHFAYTSPPFLMAGREYCCASCSVGSACEHQGIHRAPNVRRYDTTFTPFRESARSSTPYEVERLAP
ncbi:MAG TPA: hypothetical protein PL082_04340 [Tepidiformaceae bacterium]|nr:hypothetical protein [Tepidiformaceae bacterium]